MSNDLISRKWLTDAIRNRRTYLSYEDAKDVIDLIDNAPSVEIPIARWDAYCEGQKVGYEKGIEDRPHGEWIVEDWTKIIECNLCHGQAPICITSGEQYESNFCPICGAKMEGGAE